MKRELKYGELDEDNIENLDETNFIINFDNGESLDFRGDLCVKYADITSADEGMNVLVRISGGRKLYYENPFLIFKKRMVIILFEECRMI